MPLLRRGFLPMTTILAILTALTLVYAAAMVVKLPAIAPEPAQSDNAAVVRAFYAAVNLALRRGDTSALTQTVGPSTVVHRSVPETEVYGDEFVDQIIALHLAEPTLQIIVKDAIAEGVRVLVQISVEGAETVGVFGAPIPAPTIEGPTEVFRINDGIVADYQGFLADLSAPNKVLHETMTAETVHGAVGVARITMTPPATLENMITIGPTIFALETGTLSISFDGPGAIRHAPTHDATTSDGSVTMGTVEHLRPGDQLALGKEVRYTLRSTGPETAIITATTIMPSTWLDSYTYDRFGPAPQYPLSAMMYLADTPQRWGVPWPRGVSRQPLLQGDVLRLPAHPFAVTLWTITLPPGTSVSGNAPAGSAYVMVASGRALIESLDQDQNGTMLGLMAGQWSALNPHALTTASTLGGAPATLFVLTIESTDEPVTLDASLSQPVLTDGNCRSEKIRCRAG